MCSERFVVYTINYQWLLPCVINRHRREGAARHNVGFMAADELARREGVKINKLR